MDEGFIRSPVDISFHFLFHYPSMTLIINLIYPQKLSRWWSANSCIPGPDYGCFKQAAGLLGSPARLDVKHLDSSKSINARSSGSIKLVGIGVGQVLAGMLLQFSQLVFQKFGPIARPWMF